jgi:hypothetical protein
MRFLVDAPLPPGVCLLFTLLGQAMELPLASGARVRLHLPVHPVLMTTTC